MIISIHDFYESMVFILFSIKLRILLGLILDNFYKETCQKYINNILSYMQIEFIAVGIFEMVSIMAEIENVASKNAADSLLDSAPC